MGRQLKYDQAKLAVLSLIASEHLQPGDKIMTEQQLLSHLPCSRITLRKALESLAHDGMIERHVGCGTFLKQAVTTNRKNGKILFLNVNRSGELSYPPPRAREYMHFYFDERGLEFQYLQVDSFSEEILKAVDGVLGILLYGWLSDSFLKSIASLKIPMLIVGNSRRCSGIPQVDLDVTGCARLVTEELIRDGARRIALFNAPATYYQSGDIEAGFRETMKKHSLEVSQDNLIVIPDDGQDQLMDQIIPQYAHYDALIFELGIYYAFLAANRINHWDLKKKIAVLPLGSDLVEYWNRYLVRASEDTFFGRFYQSIFETASEMLLAHILHNGEMKSIQIKPEIDKGKGRRS